jgi:hypothetical protein
MVYINKAKIKAYFIGESKEVIDGSDLYFEDVRLQSGATIESDEIVDVVKKTKTEEEFKEYFYAQYGINAFDSDEMDELVKYWRQYQSYKINNDKEESKEEKEKENGESEENT